MGNREAFVRLHLIFDGIYCSPRFSKVIATVAVMIREAICCHAKINSSRALRAARVPAVVYVLAGVNQE